MPFSSQPRKKGVQVAQEGPKSSSCHTNKPEPKPTKPADPATEKKQLLLLREKIADRFEKDARAAEKAAIILSTWINKKK